MEYFVYTINEALELFGKEETLSLNRQISLWAKKLLIHTFNKKGFSFSPSIGYKENGKPFFINNKDIFFNLSHTKNFIAIAFSNTDIGIDIEKKRKYKKEIVKRFFHNKECSLLENIEDENLQDELFTRIWTIKEAYLKCTGKGIANNLNTFYITINDKNNTIFEIKDNDTPVSLIHLYDKKTQLYISICQTL
ncbi:MAG: 4'-phosphopantetheinyl transferase superfamily protein [Bacteroidales bacterium]|nr:4'-phosphopantetheinyl transferase superfamily protein [Bacteroidales bacterium]